MCVYKMKKLKKVCVCIRLMELKNLWFLCVYIEGT